MTTYHTNLAELPYNIYVQLAESLDSHERWMNIVSNDPLHPFGFSNSFSREELSNILKSSHKIGSQLLKHWGNRGITIQDFLQRLRALSKIYRHLVDEPQLILMRKYVGVIWSRPEQISIKVENDEMVKLTCHAKGFPYPHFQWKTGDENILGECTETLWVFRCQCNVGREFKCEVWNMITNNMANYHLYEQKGEMLSSKLVSVNIKLDSFINSRLCDSCVQKLHRCPKIDFSAHNELNLSACDKVALIISNSNYLNLPNLVLPHCDAETIANELQKLNFKTVTLGDLNLEEMKFIMREYRKLLGDGVYAVFYFAGHGFEINGQCYLLPVDVPLYITLECCIPIEWFLSLIHNCIPSLNVILLDICRKTLCDNFRTFFNLGNNFNPNECISRNTVYGFATSLGVSAFEERGEINGLFVKHLKKHLGKRESIVQILNLTFQDIESDSEFAYIQIPELRSNLALPRSLSDPLIFTNHTFSYEHHTLHWRSMHELPLPIHVFFESKGLRVTIWFGFAGHFTNKVYVFTNVDRIPNEILGEDNAITFEKDSDYIARLRFRNVLCASNEKHLVDSDEGVSLCLLLSGLQKCKSQLSCSVDLTNRNTGKIVASKDNIVIGNVLITKLYTELNCDLLC